MDQQIPQLREVNVQKALLDALLGNDFQTFCDLLESGQVDPLYRYGFPHFSTCLEIAARHPELPATYISKLLECGVKPNINVVVPEPIHYAARCGNAAVLRVLLSEQATRVNAVDSSGQTALHYVVLAFRDDCLPKKASEFELCIEILMGCLRFDINIIDNTGLSALHLAANKKRYRAAAAIIEKSRAAHRDLDVDRHLAGGRTAREALEAELPDLCTRLIAHGNNFPATKKRLLEAMDLGDFPLYHRLLRRSAAKDGFDVDFWFEKPYDTRLLERACAIRDPKLAAKFVRVTLDAGAHPSSVNLCSRSTPLHVATAAGNWAALKLLAEHPLVQINVKDGNGQTPLHIAALCSSSEHKHDCLELLLNATNVDVNAKDNFGRTPADLAGCSHTQTMIKDKGGLERGMSSLPQPSTGIRPIRRAAVITYDRDDGTSPLDSTVLFDGGGETIWTKPIPEKKILFDLMIQRQYSEFEELFEKISFDDNLLKCDECGYTFLQYACERGLHDFAKKLLEKVDPNETHEKNRRTPLMLACLQNDSHMVHILLNTTGIREIDINVIDHKQNTSLHYAAKNENMDIIFNLLSHGADILAKNMFGKYPLSLQELERLLDKSIEVKDNILPSNDDFVIIFNYKMLISQHTSKNCFKDHNSHLIQSSPSQAESTSGKSVLLGPRSHTKYSEMNLLNSLSSSSEYAPLLKHPLITSFLRVKDDRMRAFLSLNLILCIVFVITLNAYIIIEVGKLYENSTMVHSVQMCFCATAFVCTMFMLLRETAQLVLKTNLYVKNCENLFDLCLILTAALILLQCPLGAFTQWAFTIAILLSWRDLFIVTGRHFKFSTNVQMLKAVSLNYLQFLKSYIFIVFAFCLSFYVIFSQSNNQPVARTSDSQGNNTADIINQMQNDGEGTEAINFFENPLKTLLKTVVMMTGEFEASNLPFVTDIWLTSIVFVLFLFFLHVVLLNLLTALAVSDEQQIRGNAEILSLISQIKLLYEIENIALSLYSLFKHCRCISKHFQNLLLFSEKTLEEACLFAWPNKGTRARISGEQGDLVKKFDSKIINEAKCIVARHGHFSLENIVDTDGLSSLIQHIEHIQTNINLLLEEHQNAKLGKNMEQSSST